MKKTLKIFVAAIALLSVLSSLASAAEKQIRFKATATADYTDGGYYATGVQVESNDAGDIILTGDHRCLWAFTNETVEETPYLSFDDITFLKDMEIATDAYWNKGNFSFTMNYVFRLTSPWEFLCALVEYGRSMHTFDQARRESYWFELIYTFIIEEKWQKLGVGLENGLDKNLIYDLLRYDFVRAGKKGNFPSWYKHNYNKDKHRKLLDENGLLENSRIGFAITEYEEFDYNVCSERPELEKIHTEVLIRYK